ncbi:uncharacterized protein LOC143870065 [Tasmannia lanceolata]|uniref:uncharacterized protein LOC143870065 n=1 Tax=Tasmannia lanceolata TaxID=3420 RepID=UPI00406305DA
MAKNQNYFTHIDPTIKVPVTMGNGGLVESKGKGFVASHINKGKRFIKDVLYVPDLDQNFLSVPQMMTISYSLLFEGNACAILDPHKKQIANINMVNKTFPIQWNYTTEMSLTSQASVETSF